MRLFLSLLLFLPGLMLLPSAWLPLGLVLMLGGWWVYERSGLKSDEGFHTILLLLGALGCALVFAEGAWQALAR